jgi:hypothetical protein
METLTSKGNISNVKLRVTRSLSRNNVRVMATAP